MLLTFRASCSPWVTKGIANKMFSYHLLKVQIEIEKITWKKQKANMQVVAPWSRRPGSPKLRPKNDRPRTKPTGSQTTGSRKVEKWRWARCGQIKWTQPYSTYFSKDLIFLAQGCSYNFFMVLSNFEDSIAASWTKKLIKYILCL